MAQILLVGIGAGIASALLFASIISGAVLSLFLFYLAPLPIMIAALGWSHWSALIAALVAAVGLALGLSSYLFVAFLIGIGLPAWWLSYLALLARPVETPEGQTLEWYPVGRLVIWAAIIGSLVVVAVLLTLGQTEEAVRGELRRAFETLLRRSAPTEVRNLPDYNQRIDALVAIAPPAAAVSVTFINALLLWLAGRIVIMSGRLRRPWPDVTQMSFPPVAPVLLVAGAAGVLLASRLGLLGVISGIVVASLATAYAILGFAVLHFITRGFGARGLVLGLAYVTVVLIWPALALIALLGLADTAFDIRGRLTRKVGPPTRPS
ncbi:MAG TPA: DUF2232 domain-containing protein [Xanthobacteraceae bacterium]|nr:DUF2232 domain-containing protein [Xanthobacteraceae bacterium]